MQGGIGLAGPGTFGQSKPGLSSLKVQGNPGGEDSFIEEFDDSVAESTVDT